MRAVALSGRRPAAVARAFAGALCGLWAAAAPAGAAPPELDVRALARGYALETPPELLVSRLRTAAAPPEDPDGFVAPQLVLEARVHHRPMPRFAWFLGVDTGLVEYLEREGSSPILADGLPIGERAAETGLLGEVGASVQIGPSGVVELTGGRLRRRLAEGALYDAYGLGIEVDADLELVDPELPVRLRLLALLPNASFTERGKRSPLFDLEAEFAVAPRDRLRLFFAVARDDAADPLAVPEGALVRGALSRLEEGRAAVLPRLPAGLVPLADRLFDRLSGRLRLAGATADTVELVTEGWLGWAGVAYALRRPGFELELLGVLGLGELEARLGPSLAFEVEAADLFGDGAGVVADTQRRSGPVELLSGLVQATGRARITPQVDARAFAVWMSGDDGFTVEPRGRSRYGSFIGVAPALLFTSLFFGAASVADRADAAPSSPSPDGAGLVAGGAAVEAYPTDRIRVDAGLAVMASTVDGPEGARLYGLEGNLAADALVDETWSVHLDLAAFVPMGYFGPLSTALQGVVAVAAQWSL